MAPAPRSPPVLVPAATGIWPPNPPGPPGPPGPPPGPRCPPPRWKRSCPPGGPPGPCATATDNIAASAIPTSTTTLLLDFCMVFDSSIQIVGLIVCLNLRSTTRIETIFFDPQLAVLFESGLSDRS